LVRARRASMRIADTRDMLPGTGNSETASPLPYAQIRGQKSAWAECSLA
jgi:hypothetical protein